MEVKFFRQNYERWMSAKVQQRKSGISNSQCCCGESVVKSSFRDQWDVSESSRAQSVHSKDLSSEPCIRKFTGHRKFGESPKGYFNGVWSFNKPLFLLLLLGQLQWSARAAIFSATSIGPNNVQDSTAAPGNGTRTGRFTYGCC